MASMETSSYSSKSEATSAASSWLELPRWQSEISLSWISFAVGDSLKSLSDMPVASSAATGFFKKLASCDHTEGRGGDVDGGSLASVYKDECGIPWTDLDEERTGPIQDDSNSYDIHENVDEYSTADDKAKGATFTNFFGQPSTSWSEMRFQKWLVVLFIIILVLVAVEFGSDTKDAVDEWGKYHLEDWTGGDNGHWDDTGGLDRINDQQDALPDPQLSGGAFSGKGRDYFEAVSLFPPPPPFNLADLCSSTDGREECIATCSEAECCFVPWWNPKSCCKEEMCHTYVEACSQLDGDEGENCKGKCKEVKKDKEGGKGRRRRRGM